MTFLNGGCIFPTGRENGGGCDGGDPHGDGGGWVRGDSCGPSPASRGGGEEGNWAPRLAQRRGARFARLVRAEGAGGAMARVEVEQTSVSHGVVVVDIPSDGEEDTGVMPLAVLGAGDDPIVGWCYDG